jgi:hypothetical protein
VALLWHGEGEADAAFPPKVMLQPGDRAGQAHVDMEGLLVRRGLSISQKRSRQVWLRRVPTWSCAGWLAVVGGVCYIRVAQIFIKVA